MLTVKHLLSYLETVENKDLPVVLIADHSQTPMKMTNFGYGSVEDLDKYMMEETEEDLNNCFILEAF